MPSRRRTPLKPVAGESCGRTVALLFDDFPGQGPLRGIRAPGSIRWHLTRLELQQQQASHGQDSDRAFDPSPVCGDLCCPRPTTPYPVDVPVGQQHHDAKAKDGCLAPRVPLSVLSAMRYTRPSSGGERSAWSARRTTAAGVGCLKRPHTTSGGSTERPGG
jgi:hypothetical protein